MRRTDARSAQIGGPDSISHSFQVRTYSGEPYAAILCRNLFAKDDWRLALGDEPPKSGPQMALVIGPFSLPRDAERLAGA